VKETMMSDISDDGGKRRGLAKGLSALLGDVGTAVLDAPDDSAPQSVPVEFLRPGRYQPRRRFDDDDLAELAASIRAVGVLQPLVVRRDAAAPGNYEIVTGERRWRAAQLANLHEVPIILRDFSDREALEAAMIENVQRENLTALEEAEGYKRLADEFSHTQDALARAVGKSRSHVANTVRLLGLPDAVKVMLDDGRLSAGHGRALLGAPDPAALAADVAAKGLNVRQTERMVRRAAKGPRQSRAPAADDPNTRALERNLSDGLGLAVTIKHRDPGGSVEIRYKTLEQLDDVIRRLGGASI
jgi:ParB family chromosome partitioning protein